MSCIVCGGSASLRLWHGNEDKWGCSRLSMLICYSCMYDHVEERESLLNSTFDEPTFYTFPEDGKGAAILDLPNEVETLFTLTYR